MKKTIFNISRLLLLSIPLVSTALAEVPLPAAADCPVDESSRVVLQEKDSKDIQSIYSNVKQNACNENSIFLDIADPKFDVGHHKLRCSEVDLCLEEIKEKKKLTTEADEILAGTIPTAALIGILEQEVGKTIRYSIITNQFEESKMVGPCAVEKVDMACQASITKAIAIVGRDYFVQTNLLKDLSLKPERRYNCSNRVTINKICQRGHERVKAIAECEKTKGKGCLDAEQKAIGHLTNSFKSNKPLFLALEKQLCAPSRVVSYGITQLTSLNFTQRISGSPFSAGQGLRGRGGNVGFRANSPTGQGFRAPASAETSGSDKKEESSSATPNESEVRRIENLVFAEHKENVVEETKGFRQDGDTLSEQFTKSFEEFAQPESKQVTNNANANANWNNEFTDRFNSITEEEKNKKEEEEKKNKLEELAKIEAGESSSITDKKKKEEMSALVAQINNLKAKIDDMNANVDDLKAKKAGAVSENNTKADKDSLEREKAILDLKKRLAELEADKKKMQAESIAKAADLEKKRLNEESRKVSYSGPTQNSSNREIDNTEIQKRTPENTSGNFNQGSNAYADRSPASVGSSSSGSSGSAMAILKSSSGSQATPESSVIYMTDNELQKYPYHLKDNASNIEIDRMISINKGASIILGNSEQIIPITENGVVVLDENGKAKYKRIKISVVKNERERKQNIAREISSIADLKREEQKKRDLIRYQEMKKAIQKATN